jgi:hypothetical protein
MPFRRAQLCAYTVFSYDKVAHKETKIRASALYSIASFVFLCIFLLY